MASEIYTAPPGSGESVRGRTLPELLYEAAARYDHPTAFNQPQGDGWRSWSLEAFRDEAEEVALGLLGLGLARGDRVGLFMESDVHFCLVDFACLLAGLIDVPLYLSQSTDHTEYVLNHAGVKAVVATDADRVAEVAGVLGDAPGVVHLVQARGDAAVDAPVLPQGRHFHTMDEIRAAGRRARDERPDAIGALRERLTPGDLATIIYTSGTTGRPKGVMLSHENITHNALTSYACLSEFEKGAGREVVVSFLPLTHIFARTLNYGAINYGASNYYTTPDDLRRDLMRVRPTTFPTVPRVLEKVYGGILQRVAQMRGLTRALANWAIELAQRYEIGETPSLGYRAQLAVADVLVFRKWRQALGGRVKYVICGGAALAPELANVFAAAGIKVLQGYGLTETSPVIAYNRGRWNRAGTVGVPIPDVEVRIADDGEILTRGPHVMMGYYDAEEKTRAAIDADGWFHTGDVGAITEDGFLKITDRKKDLFKLSTGKYVMPQPLENRLTSHPLVEQAVVVGEGRKFCAALIFPDQKSLRIYARSKGLGHMQDVDELIEDPRIIARYQRLVDRANRDMDHWSTIKRFSLVPNHLTVSNDLLTPTMKVKRPKVREAFAAEIEALYDGEDEEADEPEQVTAE